MTHWKCLLDPGEFLGAQDFPTPKEVTISRVVAESIKGDGDDLVRCPCLYILTQDNKEYPRKFKVPKLVYRGMAYEFGPDIDTWPGKKVTLYAAQCMSFGDVEDCIRAQFSDATEAKMKKYIKKRKLNSKCYKI